VADGVVEDTTTLLPFVVRSLNWMMRNIISFSTATQYVVEN
jgi:hypothetical protein